ncbi:hypothetical protein THIX_30665 [Thiomonas sp. X19]|nr:hypothetical protein THIX_30665 [Thiomonas sp. X19]
MGGERRCGAAAIAIVASGPLRNVATLSQQTGGKTVDRIRKSAAQQVRAAVPEKVCAARTIAVATRPHEIDQTAQGEPQGEL